MKIKVDLGNGVAVELEGGAKELAEATGLLERLGKLRLKLSVEHNYVYAPYQVPYVYNPPLYPHIAPLTITGETPYTAVGVPSGIYSSPHSQVDLNSARNLT